MIVTTAVSVATMFACCEYGMEQQLQQLATMQLINVKQT